jgi:nitrate reductase gamma subunit
MDKYTYFWSLIIIGGTIFLIGAYKNVFLKIYFILWVNRRLQEEIGATPLPETKGVLPQMSTVFGEAVMQNRIKNRSTVLWLRHFLIFFGFMVLFAFDCVYTVFGHYLHHYLHYDYFVSGAGRAFLKFAMELSGAVLLLGLTIGLIHRLLYARQERTLIDFKLLLLLWVVTASGFLTEAVRLAAEPNDPFIAYSFIGGPLASLLRGYAVAGLSAAVWIFHATVTVAFFAYIPFSKFVHILVAPLGRSITQDRGYGPAKRIRITEGLL